LDPHRYGAFEVFRDAAKGREVKLIQLGGEFCRALTARQGDREIRRQEAEGNLAAGAERRGAGLSGELLDLQGAIPDLRAQSDVSDGRIDRSSGDKPVLEREAEVRVDALQCAGDGSVDGRRALRHQTLLDGDIVAQSFEVQLAGNIDGSLSSGC